MATQQDFDWGHDQLGALVDGIGRTILGRTERGDLATVLLLLLVRLSNTWKTIRFLIRGMPAGLINTVSIDVGALLRVMFDVYFQSAYVVHDPARRDIRARLFLD